MAVENITLNIIPTGDTPSIHVAQFDVDRHFTVTLKEGADDFTPTGYDIELQVRKVDATIVTVLPTQTSSNVVTFNTTEQMTACSGTNIAELQLTKDSQTFATLHFYLVVQRDVLAGGVTSESDIYNLTEQIAAIVPEVIGDDYYNKEEVDEKIAEIPTFDPTNYYDKSDVNTLLNAKANTSDLSAVAFSGDYDDLENKPVLPDMSDYYTKTEVDNKITDLYQIKTASGSLVHITDGGNNIPLKSFGSDIVAVQSGSGTPSPSNPRSISGFSSGVVSVNSNTYTFAFGQTVYGGHFDNKENLVVTWSAIDLGSLTWTYDSTYDRFLSNSFNIDALPSTRTMKCLCSCYQTISDGRPLAQVPNNSIYNGGGGKNLIVHDNRFTVGTDLKTAVSGQYCTYQLETPITLSITGQKIPTVKVCDISSNTGDIEVEYFTENSDGIAELIKAFI